MDASSQAIVTQSLLVRDLRSLGIKGGDTVELHASVKAIGHVVGGPTMVLRSLFDVLGPNGTVMMLASWDDSPYELAEWSEERQRAYLEETPAFDPATSPAYAGWSILAEYLRTWPGAHRSANPDKSMVAVGAKAAWLTADHPLENGYGDGSPLAKLYEVNGRILLLGAPLNTITSLHYAEHRARVPNKRTVRYKMPVLRDDRRKWVEIEELDSSTGIVDWVGGDYFPAIAREFLASGRGRAGEVGAAQSYLFEAAELVDFAVAWMERTFSQPGATGEIALRLAAAADIDEIYALYERVAAEGVAWGLVAPSGDAISAQLGPLSFVAVLNGQVIGHAAGTLHTSDGHYGAVTPAGERYLEVDDLYVAQAFRGMGVGGRLVEALITAARGEGIVRVHVFTSTKDHDRIVRFYRRRGFQPWGVQLFR